MSEIWQPHMLLSVIIFAHLITCGYFQRLSHHNAQITIYNQLDGWYVNHFID